MAMQRLTADDFDQVRCLLEGSGLIASDLDVEDIHGFLGIRVGRRLAAVGGVQTFGDDALLRSVATADDYRGRGYGAQLVRALEADARERGTTRLFLLTETADRFFERQGYRVIVRGDAPPAILRTPQFAGLCPDAAVCMVKML